MENQTRFDLNTAIESWRQELAKQLNFSSDDRRELETHLRDSIAGFQQQGLNEEESFWLARRRVGQPERLGEEFLKVDPANGWRERMFWMWLAVCLLIFLGSMFRDVELALQPVNSTGKFVGVANLILTLMPILTPMALIMIVVVMRSKKIIRQFSKLRPLLENRLRLAFTAFVFIAISLTFTVISEMIYAARTFHPGNINSRIWAVVALNCPYQLFFALVLIWLLPVQNQMTSKRA
jgi:hypothetical protein